MTLRAAGGWHAIFYSLKRARRAGGIMNVVRRLRLRNACKTCALGMGGQLGGMVNERGHFPEVCKKSVQAQAGDMQAPIAEAFFRATSIAELESPESARARGSRAGSRSRSSRGRATRTSAARLGRGARSAAAGALARRGPARVTFYSSGRARTRPRSCCSRSRAPTARPTSTTARSTATRPRASRSRDVVGSGTASVDARRPRGAPTSRSSPARTRHRTTRGSSPSWCALRRRGGKVIVVNPLRELGLVRFRVPSDRRACSSARPSPTSTSSRTSAATSRCSRRCSRACSSAARSTAPSSRRTPRAGTPSSRMPRDADWDALVAASASRAPRSSAAAGLYAARSAASSSGRWASRTTRTASTTCSRSRTWRLRAAGSAAPGAGLLPIRGHSNVQGVGSVGVTPALQARISRRRWSARTGSGSRAERGLTTFESMEAAHEGRHPRAVPLGGNLFGSNPDRRHARAALSRVGTTVSLTTKLNRGHVHGRGRNDGDPARARARRGVAGDDAGVDVQLRPPLRGRRAAGGGELRSEVEVIAALAARVLPRGRFDWRAPALARRRARRDRAGRAGLQRDRRDRRDAARVRRRGPQPPRARFPDALGTRALPRHAASPHTSPRRRAAPDDASLGGAVQHGRLRGGGRLPRQDPARRRHDGRRGCGPRWDSSPATACGSSTEAGSADAVVASSRSLPGNLAMYYPEANVLVPREIDPDSGTPAFKSVVVRVEKDPLRTPVAVRVEEVVLAAAKSAPPSAAPIPAPAASASNP